MPSRKKCRISDGELADSKRQASEAGQASSAADAVDVGAACGIDALPSTSTSSHDLHSNLPLFVTGPATIHANSGVAWCHGWRLQSAKQGDGDDASMSLRKLGLAVPAGTVARVEAAPLGPGDVPLTARSCRIVVTVPKDHTEATATATAATARISRAFPQNGAAGAAAAATLPPPPPASWRAAAASICSGAQASVAAGGGPPSVVVVGPKNAGKSSFARLLTNELLSSFSSSAAAAAANDSKSASVSSSPVVAWCDADCGQPELTPPGLVSLCHLSLPLLASGGISSSSRSGGCGRAGIGSDGGESGGGGGGAFQPARAHFLGAPSPASDPDRACAAVSSLLSWHWQHGIEGDESGGANERKKKTSKRSWPPLVVNTPGWVRGAGLDVLRAALAAARPTHVVRLSTGNTEKDAPAVFELFDGGCLPPFLEVIELPALRGSGGNGSNVGGGGDHNEDDEDAAAPPPSLFRGIFPSPAAPTRHSAADSRTALWLAFARSCVESAAADDDDDDEEATEADEDENEEEKTSCSPADLPAALAAARPMVLPLSSVRLEFLGERPSNAKNALRVLNGSIVALAAAAEAGKGIDSDDEEDSASASAPPSPTIALALVRAVDGKRGLVHLLCPLRSAEAAAAGVVALQVGASLELPPALLSGGAVSFSAATAAAARSDNGNEATIAVSASPYLAPWCLAAGGTGARAAKARNDLARGGVGGARARD